MTTNFEHYITRNIRSFYHRRLFAPILYMLLLTALWFIFPLSSLLAQNTYDQSASLRTLYQSGEHYVKLDLTDLTFTGYTSIQFGRTNGYYYFTQRGDQPLIVLLSPSTSEEGIPFIESLTVRGRIIKADDAYRTLLDTMADALNWTSAGITKELPAHYFSEPAYNPITTTLLFVVYFGTGIYSFLLFVIYVLYTRFPVLAPACQNLIVFGKPSQMLEEAEEELATLPQLATEDMFITEHYFIMTSPYGNAIVPISEMLWIYKHSTLHKFLWYHFSISYTMHIIARKHFYVHCPKNIKSDIDGIMDYLAEANHDICVGFSEENRLKVEKVLGKPFHIEKIIAFLRRKV